MSCPVELNFLLPFLQRAYEMAEAQPVMAYYCKFYAVSLALKGGPTKFKRTPQTDAFLAKLFDDLEEEKSRLKDHSTIKDLSQGAILVRELAYRVFLSAEKQESTDPKRACQSFLAAISFLQVYRGVFLEDPTALGLEEEERAEELGQVEEKSKYAKWRVVEIKKQLLMADIEKNRVASPQSTVVSPKMPSIPSPQLQSQTQSQMPQTHAQIQSPQINPTTTNSSSPTLLYDPKVLNECEKHARHAISALNFDDIQTAADNLRAALNILEPLLKKNSIE